MEDLDSHDGVTSSTCSVIYWLFAQCANAISPTHSVGILNRRKTQTAGKVGVKGFCEPLINTRLSYGDFDTIVSEVWTNAISPIPRRINEDGSTST
jgi:hypothetical protein